MEIIKNYLTSEELTFIVNELKEVKNPVERHIIKIGLLCQLLIKNKEFENFTSCNDYYDWYMAKDDIDFEYDLQYFKLKIVDNLVDEYFRTSYVVKEFLDEVEKKIDEIDLKTFENVLEKTKEEISNGKISVQK